MSSRQILPQRDLLARLKRETCSNLDILSKLYPLTSDLSPQIFKEDAVEKPTQYTFIHLTYYLVQIIDAQKVASFTWPLYDSKSEKIYRNELSLFIASYSSTSSFEVLAPVPSCLFVNPGCFKVTKLVFQLSHLAVQQALRDRMRKDSQKARYNVAAKKYETGSKDFMDHIEIETTAMFRRFQTYQQKREAMISFSEAFRKMTIENELKLEEISKQNLLQNLVADFIKNHSLGELQKAELEKIKDITEPSKFLEDWQQSIDDQVTQMESGWESKMRPVLDMAQYCQKTSEALIMRHTGEMDKNMYMVEYDPQKDDIAITIKDLESHVNPYQRHKLQSIIKDEKLNFPNLIRGFVIAICCVQKQTNYVDDNIYQINEYLQAHKRKFDEMVSALQALLQRVAAADARLQMSPPHICEQAAPVKLNIPTLPDFSDLRAANTLQYQGMLEPFTPLNLSKHQFNLRRKAIVPTFAKPQPRSLATPLHTSKNDFLKVLNSCKVNMHERPKLNMSQNISIVSQGTTRGNETIAECSSGFTKQQIQRLLSTKKSSTKKLKHNLVRPQLVIKKRGLFNESIESSGTLYRSHSSPNLFEDKEKRPASKRRGRKLSIMQEDTSFLGVSGIVALDSASNSGCGTPVEMVHSSQSHPLSCTTSLPTITISPMEPLQHKYPNRFGENGCGNWEADCGNDIYEDFNKEIVDEQTKLEMFSEKNVVHKPLESLFPVNIAPTQFLQKFEQIIKGTDDLQYFAPSPKKDATRKSLENNYDAENQPFKHSDMKENGSRKSTDSLSGKEHSVTPKSNIPVRKSSSLEKIINRYKKVRASVIPENRDDSESLFKPILEEKENHNTVNIDVFKANRVLLPDLLSPSCSISNKPSTDLIDLDTFGSDVGDEKPIGKPRESLGTMLGVDQTILDQFDLMD